VKQESKAIRIARAHIDAWSKHDWDKTRELLSPEIHAVVTTTEPTRATAEFTGVANYMERKTKGALLVEPGSAHVISAIGDDRNALVLATMRIGMGPGGTMVNMGRACLYLLDEDNRIKEERDEWFILSE
jgi:ketosteroid isomerase-like protein